MSALGLFLAIPAVPPLEASSGAPTYATWNPADKNKITLSNGDLTATATEGYWAGAVRATVGLTSGKHRYKMTACSASFSQGGLMAASESLSSYIGSGPKGWGFSSHGYVYNSGSYIGPTTTFGPGDVLDIYVNLDDDEVNVFIGNTLAWTIDVSARGASALYPAFSGYEASNTGAANFGALGDLGAAKAGTDGYGNAFSSYRSGVYAP